MAVKYKDEGGKLIINTEALCALLCVSRMAIKKWADEGCPKHSRGWWDLAEVLKWKGMVGSGNLKSVNDSKDMSFKEKKLYFSEIYEIEPMLINSFFVKGKYFGYVFKCKDNSKIIVKSNDIEDLELFMEKLFDLFPKEMIREI